MPKKTVTRNAGTGQFVDQAEAQASPETTITEEIVGVDVTDKGFLRNLAAACRKRGEAIGKAVNPTNIFVTRLNIIAEQCDELIEMMQERGHRGIPEEAE